MSDQIYKLIELTGTSDKSLEDAVSAAIERAAKTVRNMRWFEICETRGTIEDGKVAKWHVMLKVGFRLDEPA